MPNVADTTIRSGNVTFTTENSFTGRRWNLTAAAASEPEEKRREIEVKGLTLLAASV
jgi:hypothetical protein